MSEMSDEDVATYLSRVSARPALNLAIERVRTWLDRARKAEARVAELEALNERRRLFYAAIREAENGGDDHDQ